MDFIPTDLPLRMTGVVIRDHILSEASKKRYQEQQMAEFRKAVRQQGWSCLGGCGRRISANVTLCKACAEKQAAT